MDVNELEPISLARKIQSLISPIFSSATTTSKRSFPPASSPVRTQIHPNQCQERFSIPSSLYDPGSVSESSPLQDPHLLAMLSSPVVMNGNLPSEGLDDRRERRVSVFNILDSMVSPQSAGGGYGALELGGDQDSGREVHKSNDWEEGNSVFSDDSSVMMYSPLIPTSSSLVELAESEVMVMSAGSASPTVLAEEKETSKWSILSFNTWRSSSWSFAKSSGKSKKLKSDSPSEPARQVSRRVWVPSTTKLSLQAIWWGYRLYLPPPILEALSDHHIEASNRAAVFTAALTWFFGNFPIKALPGPLQPAAILLQAIIPFVGYIGTFVSWTWTTIKSYDTGHGVILTATWLLPVALIPSTWNEADFPPASPRAPVPTIALPSEQEGLHSPLYSPGPRPMSMRFQPLALPLPTPESTPVSQLKPPLPPTLPYSLPSPSSTSFSPTLLSPLGSPPMSDIHLHPLSFPVIHSSPYQDESPLCPQTSSPSSSAYQSAIPSPPVFWSPQSSIDPQSIQACTSTDMPQPWATPPPAPTPQTISLPEIDSKQKATTSSVYRPAPSRRAFRTSTVPDPALSAPSSYRRIPGPSSSSFSTPSAIPSPSLDGVRTLARRATGKEKRTKATVTRKDRIEGNNFGNDDHFNNRSHSRNVKGAKAGGTMMSATRSNAKTKASGSSSLRSS